MVEPKKKHLFPKYSKADSRFLMAGHMTTFRFSQADDLVIFPATSRMAKGKIIITRIYIFSIYPNYV
jgi:hypothetical protein